MPKVANSPFRVPKPDLVPKPGEAVDAKAIKAWVEGLPTANVGHTARELYHKLKWLNRLDIPPAERRQALSLMQPVLLYVLDSLANHYVREHLPLSERNRLVAELARDLMTRMVVGYKTLFRQYAEKGASLINLLLYGKARAEALGGMLYYLGRLLLQSYQLYRDIPPCTWQEVHAAYHWAEEGGVQSKGLHNEPWAAGRKTSVSELYKQILLLSLASPYRMFQGEAEKVYLSLQHRAGHCKLIPFGEAVASDVKFAVFRTLDAPPGYRERLGQQEGLQGWYLDTCELSTALSKELEGGARSEESPRDKPLRLSSSSEPLVDGLKRRLLLAWGAGFKRLDQRARDAGKAQVAVGLENVYALVGGVGETLVTDLGIGVKVVSELSPEEEAVFQNESLARAEWQLSEGNIDVSKEVFDRSERTKKRLKKMAKVCVEAAEVLDRSDHGFHFVWSAACGITPQVGELVAIGGEVGLADEEKWKLGVIRWLREYGDEHIEFGVEIVSDEIEPVMLWYFPHGSEVREEFCSLLVPLPGEGEAVIVPTFYPHEQDRVLLVHEESELPIRFTQLMEYTGYFSKYRFSPLSEQTVENEGSDEDGFKELWHDL